jgi:hypothetical protein
MKLGAKSGYLLPLLIVALIGLSGAGYFYFANRSTPIRVGPPPFSSDSIYDRVQVSMTYEQVTEIAGQPASCEYSSAPPPTDFRICYWPDPSGFSISFQNNLVTAKNYTQDLQPPAPAPFNAGQFYDRVQVGMGYDEVTSLAGKPGDCGTTAVHPPSDLMSCTWQDNSTAVTVGFKGNLSTGKTKRSL